MILRSDHLLCNCKLLLQLKFLVGLYFKKWMKPGQVMKVLIIIGDFYRV